MKILLRKRLDGALYPMDEEAESALKRLKAGKDCWCEIKVARDPVQHRRYFGLLTLTFENQERYTNIEHFRKAVQIKAGHVEELITLDGEVLLMPKSIAWGSLDQLEFDMLFGQVMRVCADILGMEGLHELEQEVARWAA